MGFLDFIFPKENDVRTGKAVVQCPHCYHAIDSKKASWAGLCPRCKSLLQMDIESRGQVDEDYFKKLDFDHAWLEQVTGFTHKHDGYDPQKVITSLNTLQQLYMIWDVNNPYDQTALKILTPESKYVGWYPRNGQHKDLLILFIQHELPYSITVSRTYQNYNHDWRCEIMIVPPFVNLD
ncbi:hypothetical protein RWV98_05680 [Agathobaculum sp. NTUH-O15-33]|uniref:hypothetical protein n=1 Tax=Agathobaculum sp. NTUH-O15-33 TaxID=3079302 RepID=UPI0029588248|nr:hypothetical protein [Agathobaculum sp. NTUH-O15-33]WNX85757.1 hypothetical protein RWV98_05680 [Agathobaculum sp. NTUH-O15-33]